MISISSLFKNNFKNIFIIHQHNTKNHGIHFDLRVEKDGVLESWASKQLSEFITGKIDKVILFRQPQHQLEWFNFKDEITDDFGAGNISVYDKGRFKVIKWEKNIIILNFKGTKISGVYTLHYYGENKWIMFRSMEALV